MLSRLLFTTLLTSSFLGAQTLSDICYEVPNETGLNMGPIGVMTKTTTPIHNISNSLLSNIEVTLTSSTLFSIFSDCGVNDVSGNCENSAQKSIMSISMFDEGVSFTLPNLEDSQTHTTYISSFFSFLSSDQYQWLGSYVKDGITYTGIIDPCLDPNSVQIDPLVFGTLNVENNSYNGENITLDNLGFNTLFTQIVNKEFTLKVVKLEDDLITPTTYNGKVKIDLIPTPTTQTTCKTNIAIKSQHADFNGSSFLPFNTTSEFAGKDLSFRVKYLKDQNGQMVQWNSVYQCQNADGSTNYDDASCMWSLLKYKAYDSTKCNMLNNYSGTDCECSDVCNSSTNSSENIDTECRECIFNSNLVQSTCSRDNFAIIPKKFQISNVEENITSADEFNITIQALDENSQPVQNYNEFITIDGISPAIIYNEAKTECETGEVTPVSLFKFNNGVAVLTLKYSEVGELNISIQDKQGSEFAIVDAKDSANRFIQSDTKTISLLPYYFELNASYVNFNNANFTYLSRDLDMASVINITLSSKNKDNNTTKNYNSQCYAKATDYNVSFELGTIQNLTKIIYKKDDNTSAENEINITNSNFILNNVSKDIFTVDNKGVATIHVKVNFDRSKNKAVNPFELTVKEVLAKDENNISGSTSINQKATFVFGRTYAPRQKFKDIDVDALLYFETYCGLSCDKTLLPDGENSNYLDDPRWFINTKHISSNFGDVGDLSQKGFNTDITANADSGYSVPKIHLNYNTSKGFPYKATIENKAPSWLIYNKYKEDDITNEFSVEFYKEDTNLVGIHDTNTSVKKSGTAQTNRRIMW